MLKEKLKQLIAKLHPNSKNKNKNNIYEIMTKIKWGYNWSVRVWWQTDQEEIRDRDITFSLKEYLLDLYYSHQELIDPAEILVLIASDSRVSAIEIIDKEGDGILRYNNWP
jgi:hypothetical protein